MKTIRPPRVPAVAKGEAWRTCRFCGGKYRNVELTFDSGSVEPQEDETLTGATSGATGEVEEVVLLSGSYANGDAKGVVELSSPTGITSQTNADGDVIGVNDVCFSDDELINGSTGGDNIMTANGDGIVKKYGQFYPESLLIERDGNYYCLAHYDWYFSGRDRDDIDVSGITEEDRGSTW